MKSRRVVMMVTMALVGSAALPVAAQKPITVYFDGEEARVRFLPIVQNGRTLVHIREAFERLGATVWWNPTDQSILAWRSEDEVKLQIGNSVATVNGRPVQLDQPPVLHQYSPADRGALVPLRFVSQALGAKVSYDGRQHRVDINTEKMSFANEKAVYSVGQQVQVLSGHTWYPGTVLKVRDYPDQEDNYTVRMTQRSGREITVSVLRSKLRRPR